MLLYSSWLLFAKYLLSTQRIVFLSGTFLSLLWNWLSHGLSRVRQIPKGHFIFNNELHKYSVPKFTKMRRKGLHHNNTSSVLTFSRSSWYNTTSYNQSSSLFFEASSSLSVSGQSFNFTTDTTIFSTTGATITCTSSSNKTIGLYGYKNISLLLSGINFKSCRLVISGFSSVTIEYDFFFRIARI